MRPSGSIHPLNSNLGFQSSTVNFCGVQLGRCNRRLRRFCFKIAVDSLPDRLNVKQLIFTATKSICKESRTAGGSLVKNQITPTTRAARHVRPAHGERTGNFSGLVDPSTGRSAR